MGTFVVIVNKITGYQELTETVLSKNYYQLKSLNDSFERVLKWPITLSN